jgi:hypothetical protein
LPAGPTSDGSAPMAVPRLLGLEAGPLSQWLHAVLTAGGLPAIADFAEKMTTYAGSAADPGEYGKLIAARLCPDTLPYSLGTSAAFEVASFNGRALGDDGWM